MLTATTTPVAQVPRNGGGGGIRTLGELSPTSGFKSGALIQLSHSSEGYPYAVPMTQKVNRLGGGPRPPPAGRPGRIGARREGAKTSPRISKPGLAAQISISTPDAMHRLKGRVQYVVPALAPGRGKEEPMFTASPDTSSIPNATQLRYAMHSPSPAPNADQGTAGSASCILEWRGTGLVLVVEDEMAIRIVLSRALTRLGFKVTLAADGAEAVTQFRAAPGGYALALLDFKLPGMTSEDVLREIRRLRPDLPVILTSGYDRDEAMNRSSGMAITSFLHKPFTVDSLATELRFALGS